MPDVASIIEEQTQIDPTLRTQRCYVKLSANYIYKELMLHKAYQLKAFCLRSINNILNRQGYTLKKVLKTKPLKKVGQTDAIFENVALRHEEAKRGKTLRISLDVKAKVKVGNLSRGGYSRSLNAPRADDHDQHWDATLVPLGIKETATDDVFLVFGNSKETSDFIVDGLEHWWEQRFDGQTYDLLMIDLDNGKPVAGNTRRFIQRMVGFAQRINMPVQLVYYPPYHSKYNPIERVWAALEQYWNGLILDTVPNTLKIAAQMTWRGMNPIVQFLDKVYEKPQTISLEEFKELDKFLIRHPVLHKWDIRINPVPSG